MERTLTTLLALIVACSSLIPLVSYAQEAHLSDGSSTTLGMPDQADIYAPQIETASSNMADPTLASITGKSSSHDASHSWFSNFFGWFGRLFVSGS